MLTNPQLYAPGVQVVLPLGQPRFARDAKLRRFTSTGARGSDVVEDAVVPKAELVNRDGRKDVGLADGDIACVIDDALIAAERALLRESGSATGDERSGLIVAEAGEQAIRVGEILVHADIEFCFI